MRFLESLSEKTNNWKLKKFLKPVYLPFVHKVKYLFLNKKFKKEGDNILKLANRAFEEIGLFSWLEFGTLLGVVRDGKLIEHDTDIDVGVLLKDYSPRIEEVLTKHGFVKSRKFEIDNGEYGIEESYELNGISFDIFYFTENKDGMYCHLFPIDEKGDFVIRELFTGAKGFKQINWEGEQVNIPLDSDQRLRDTYGDYTIKIKNWYTPDQALNSKIINKKINVIKY